MKNIKFSALLLAMALVLTFNTYSSSDKEDVYNKLAAKFGSAKTFYAKFSQSGNKTLRGTITAVRGGKYILEFGNRTIYCNGENVWNYSIADKSVVISKYDRNSGDFRLEDIFFEFLDKYTPAKLTSERSSNGRSSLVLKIEPKVSSNSYSGIASIEIGLASDSQTIQFVRVNRAGNVSIWEIQNLIVNKNIPDKSFEFIPPEGVKVIDLR